MYEIFFSTQPTICWHKAINFEIYNFFQATSICEALKLICPAKEFAVSSNRHEGWLYRTCPPVIETLHGENSI